MANTETMNKEAVIIAEAAKLFLYKGFHATSMDDISQAVGLAKGSLYHYFTGKEEILGKCLEGPTKASIALMEEVVRTDVTPREKLRLAIQAQVQIIHDYPALFLAVQENFDLLDVKLREEILQFQNHYERLWDEVIAAGVESGQFRSDIRPRLIVYGILGMCNWMFRWYRRGGPLTASQIGNHYSNLLIGGLLNNTQNPASH